MIPEDLYGIPSVQALRAKAADIIPRFLQWQVQSKHGRMYTYRNPYSLGCGLWVKSIKSYLNKAVYGVVVGDPDYVFYMCARAYHQLLAMAAFLRDRPGYRVNFKHRQTNPGLETHSLVDQALAADVVIESILPEVTDVDFHEEEV